MAASEGRATTTALNLLAALCNGFYHANPGYHWVERTINNDGQ
jgi:hypothetical protein